MRAVYASVGLLIALCIGVAVLPALQAAIGSGATALIKPLMLPLVELINVPAFVYVIATVLFFSGVAVCAAFWWRVARPRLRQLRLARDEIFGLPMPAKRDDALTWPEARRQMGVVLRKHLVFVSAWAAFQTREARSGVIPDEPFQHFVDTEPTDARDRGGFMHHMSGYFTSVGLIFTFVGLVVALYFAAKGFKSGDVTAAHDAIVRLLSAASFKFLTSVAALFSALIISLTLRISLSLIARERQITAELIESFLAVWRERTAASQVQGNDTALIDRLDAVLEGFVSLAQQLDRLLQRTEQPDLRTRLHASI